MFNIQRFSLHDGAGIRTLVFLKGCPMRCRWCSNPEGQSCAPQLAYDARRCIGRSECGNLCLEACDARAIHPAQGDEIRLDLDACVACGDCVPACPARALEQLGQWMSVEEVLHVVEEDSAFYARSGGGLTLSGGEPLLQADFAAALLAAARERGTESAVETAGCVPFADVLRVCRHADEVFFDVKTLDAERHHEGTGVGNERILENLRRLCERLPELSLVVRTPVIPQFNDSPEEIRAIARFVAALPGRPRYELLPYHHFGESKYRELGRDYPLAGLAPPDTETMSHLAQVAQEVREGAPR